MACSIFEWPAVEIVPVMNGDDLRKGMAKATPKGSCHDDKTAETRLNGPFSAGLAADLLQNLLPLHQGQIAREMGVQQTVPTRSTSKNEINPSPFRTNRLSRYAVRLKRGRMARQQIRQTNLTT